MGIVLHLQSISTPRHPSQISIFKKYNKRENKETWITQRFLDSTPRYCNTRSFIMNREKRIERRWERRRWRLMRQFIAYFWLYLGYLDSIGGLPSAAGPSSTLILSSPTGPQTASMKFHRQGMEIKCKCEKQWQAKISYFDYQLILTFYF